MRRAAQAVLVVAAVLLVGCTPSQSPTGAANEQVSATADSTTAASAAPAIADAGPTDAATESDEAGPTDAPASDPSDDTTPSDDAPRDDADEEADQRRSSELVAVDEDGRGDDVEALQKRLAKHGFAPGPVDGAYGPRTEAAVKAFQELADIEASGRADARTVAALEAFETGVKILEAGAKGKAVKRLQRRLADSPLDPGPVDGAYGPRTVQAVWALEKLAGVPVDGNWGPLDEDALRRLERGDLVEQANSHNKRWVEFDLSTQVMTVYDPDASEPVLISHGSSGSGVPWQNEEHSGNSITPAGDFVISRRIDGWRESSLDIGRLYNPLYFNGGIAFHGATSVPLYPASHGCVRLPMHIAEYLPSELPNGTPVHVVQ
ncbi:MAG: L,D-transpeptidase family protein [Actinobacteria bacterium]|nr:L,D-transpeptidase family protein [Actinomycetota bacterium]